MGNETITVGFNYSPAEYHKMPNSQDELEEYIDN